MINATAVRDGDVLIRVPAIHDVWRKVWMIHLERRVHNRDAYKALSPIQRPRLRTAENLMMPLIRDQWIVRERLAPLIGVQFSKFNIRTSDQRPRGLQFLPGLHADRAHMP